MKRTLEIFDLNVLRIYYFKRNLIIVNTFNNYIMNF